MYVIFGVSYLDNQIPARSFVIQVIVTGVRQDLQTYQYQVFLYDPTSTRQMTIWVDPYIADALTATLQGKPRTLGAHDLVIHVIRAWDARLVRIIINKFTNNSFRATLILDTPQGTRNFESKPSDAIVIALRMEVPIYVAKDLFDSYATKRPQDIKKLPPARPPTDEERKGLKPFEDAFHDEPDFNL